LNYFFTVHLLYNFCTFLSKKYPYLKNVDFTPTDYRSVGLIKETAYGGSGYARTGRETLKEKRDKKKKKNSLANTPRLSCTSHPAYRTMKARGSMPTQRMKGGG